MNFSRGAYSVYFRKAKAVYQQPIMTASVEVILSVFVVGLMVMFAIRPTLAIVVGLRKKIADQELVDQKLTSKISSLGMAQQTLNTNSSKLGLFDSAVPDLPDLEGFSKRVELLAQETGVRIESFSVGGVPLLGSKLELGKITGGVKTLVNGSVTGLDVTFSIYGQSGQLVNFVKGLELLDRLVLFRQVSLQKQEAKDKSLGVMKLTGRADIFYKFKQ